MNRLSDSTLEYLKKVRASITGQKDIHNGTSLITVELVVPTEHVEFIYTEKDNYLKIRNILLEAVQNDEIDKYQLESLVDEVFGI